MIRLVNLTKQEYLCPIDYGFDLKNKAFDETNPDNTFQEVNNEVILLLLTNTSIDNPEDNKRVVYGVLEDWLGDNIVVCNEAQTVLTNPNLKLSTVSPLFNYNTFLCICRENSYAVNLLIKIQP